MKRATLDELVAARSAEKPVALATVLESGVQAVIYADTPPDTVPIGAVAVSAAQRALLDDRSVTVETEDSTLFVHVYSPPRRMFIVGAVHIAQALVPMAGLAGYAVTVIDPRRAFATDERFPFAKVVKEWPDKALERLAPDKRSAIITLTHDPKLDEPTLRVALKSEAFYIGALGSKKTQAARRERLAQAGFTEQTLLRLHGPVGLPIGARTPGEIAIAIMAEITQTLRATSSKNL